MFRSLSLNNGPGFLYSDLLHTVSLETTAELYFGDLKEIQDTKGKPTSEYLDLSD